MFTGIVQRTISIRRVEDHAGGRAIVFPATLDSVELGESVAINGVCLTVASLERNEIRFDVIKETLTRTNLGSLCGGDDVNIERSLRAGDRIDGHFVQGHIDGVGRLARKIADQSEWRLTIEAPSGIARYLVSKGSICVDGVSLTIAGVDGNSFEVALIPTTLGLTTLGARDVGWMFNLEAEILSKQIVHFLESRHSFAQKSN